MKIVHRDIKSSNIFIHKVPFTNENILRIGDFGAATFLDEHENILENRIGTPYYLAPEVIQSYPYNYKSDMWSLGVIMYEILTLRKPFYAKNLRTLSRKVLRAKYPPFPKYYSFSITKVISSLLQREPSHRPSALSLLTLPQLLVHIPLEYKHSLLRVLYPSVYSPLYIMEANYLYTPPCVTNDM
uniref:non-specific serine/threonine protein kinase n=2 Tax=Lygus hesperus TaxID=30085 RepID=A0A0A9Y7B5_LYGHE